MAKRLPIASRRNQDKFYENGTTTIRIPVLGKSGNCQKPPGSPPRKSPIGSKIDDKGTERRKERGKKLSKMMITLGQKSTIYPLIQF